MLTTPNQVKLSGFPFSLWAHSSTLSSADGASDKGLREYHTHVHMQQATSQASNSRRLYMMAVQLYTPPERVSPRDASEKEMPS